MAEQVNPNLAAEETPVSETATPETTTPETPASKGKSFLQKPLDPRLAYYLRIIGTLFAITAAVAVLLSLVNLLTKPFIDAHAEEKRIAALSAVMPDAQYETVTQLPDGIDGLLAMTRATQDGAPMGYCVQVTSNGFGGAMELMVGVDENGAITGVSILSHSETCKTDRHSWLVEQYSGRSGQVLVSNAPADDTHVQAISGATVTSNGVTQGVNAALQAVAAYTKGGNS